LVKKILVEKFFDPKFFLVQNHFPGNSLDEKILVEKFFDRKFFLVENVFVCKIISSQNLDEKILVEKCLVEFFLYHFLGNRLDEKNFGRKIVWSKILLLRTHFLGNSLDEKDCGP